MKFWQVLIIVLAAILLISGLAAIAAIWQPWKINSRTIKVTGEGKVTDTPDVYKVSVGFETTTKTVEDGQKQLTTKVNQLVEAVKKEGVAEKDIQTEEISSTPKQGDQPIPLGTEGEESGSSSFSFEGSKGNTETNEYLNRVTITITIREKNKQEAVWNAITKIKPTSFYGPQLTFSDEKLKRLKDEARTKAIEDARKKAEDLAKANDDKVGKTVSITETSSSNDYYYPILKSESASDLQSKGNQELTKVIQPGTNEVIVTVSVIFRLK